MTKPYPGGCECGAIRYRMRPEMMRRFMRLGVSVEGGMRLDQPCIAYHFALT